jgi:hypothetical protein
VEETLGRIAPRYFAFAVSVSTLIGLGAMASCADDDVEVISKTDAGGYPTPGPGEICDWPPDPLYTNLTFQPASIVLAPGQTREVDLVMEPDVCVPTSVKLTSGDASVVAAPESQKMDLLTPKVKLKITGVAAGKTTITAAFPRGDGTDETETLDVEVMSPDIAACSGSGSGKLDDGGTVKGSGGLAAASISLQAGATKPNSGSYLWHVDAFDATIACAPDQVPTGFDKLGPAVTFGPVTSMFKREIPFRIPVNPATLPDAATIRHVTVSYTGPRVNKPRAIPVANPRFVSTSDGWALEFMAPWLGTYQAVVRSDAGTRTHTRHLTHRSIVGISMGGGGTAMFGMRNHDRFDVIAPLGGPVDWTWMLGHIEKNHMGGFPANDQSTPPASANAPDFAKAPLPYEHPSTFNEWWYEFPKTGNGGSFPRSEYVQIFRDLALMFGNPNSYNQLPNAENLPAGISPDDDTVTGGPDHAANPRECAVWVDPIGGTPTEAKQKELDQKCPVDRCKFTTTLTNYYDAKYNPDGTYPVITVCDGASRTQEDEAKSPWANQWKQDGNNKPLELALAVDYNGDGIRQGNEPIISQGHEPYQDVGIDGKADVDEPGYQAGVNEDPNGDDWHPQYNPTGTEGNLRYDEGEPYDDYGLDGVNNTKSSPYDFGEGNGKFDYAAGYRTFLERDSRSVIEELPIATQKAKLDDEAMARVDMWTDGGTRDLFNFAVDAQALAGAWFSRDRVVHYYTETQNIPGQDPTDPKSFSAAHIDWTAIPSGALLRYGKIDPEQKDIDLGSGQHVGTPDEITRRLQAALYFIGSRWPDAPRTYDEASNINPDPDLPPGVVNGAYDYEFTDSRGRTGPVSINVPPGYANLDLKDKRYPVIYLLHGYGQTPEDLKAAIVFLSNWMNYPGDSEATRLPKAIMVYVDGRCRPNKNPGEEAECIRGTFYTDSVRDKGPKMEQWFLELMDDIDKRFRTMGPSDIEWTE